MNSQLSHQHLFLRIIILCCGLILMAFGVSFSIKANLGTSPISSVPYVTSVIFHVSVGTTTIITNCLFVVLQIVILRKKYQWFQLLQIPAAILFGVMIDFGSFMIQNITYSTYLQQCILCIIGIVFIALGVSLEVIAALITTAGEGIVLAICQISTFQFGNLKVIFDVTLVCLSIIISFLFLGRLDGVREGTIAAAICVGLLSKLFLKLLNRLKERF